MKKLIAATTFSVLMAAGGAFAQTSMESGAAGSAGTEGDRMTAPAPVYDSTTPYSADIGTGVDTTTTGSISENSNCTPASGTNPSSIPAEQRAPAVQSCNPR